MPELKLPTDSRTAVWRLLVKTLKADPVLARTIKTWLVWTEPIKTEILLNTSTSPQLKLTPSIGPQSWYTPDSNIGPLQVKVECDLLTWNVDDILNLWGAIERALYPEDRTKELAIEQEFREAGAETGHWEFSQPIQDSQAGQFEVPQSFRCVGMLQIQVIRSIRA